MKLSKLSLHICKTLLPYTTYEQACLAVQCGVTGCDYAIDSDDGAVLLYQDPGSILELYFTVRLLVTGTCINSSGREQWTDGVVGFRGLLEIHNPEELVDLDLNTS